MTPTDMARQASQRRARYMQLRGSVSAQQAANIGALARQNPSLSVGALYSAGVGGVQPGTPAAQALNQGDQREQGNFFQRAISAGYKGVRVVGGALLPDEVGQAARAAAPAVKGFTRGADIGLSSIGQTFQGAFR